MKRVLGYLIGIVLGIALSSGNGLHAADAPGVWKLTGNMATSRRQAQREQLRDGRILVVGGTNTTGIDGSASLFYDSAEIYDPASGMWIAAASLTTGGRALHTSTKLPDGRILVAGGWNGSAALSSAEIYDPATGTWTPTGSLVTARAGHRDQILFDGRVLITGGFSSPGTPLASAEIFNPATGTFTATAGPMATARSGHRMNVVGGGKILITGGFGISGVALASSELFDPATGTFSLAASLAHARGHHFATELPTGEVLVSGGNDGSAVLNSTELYNADTDTFTAAATLNQARQGHSSRLLPNGLVLISGGNNNPSTDWDIQTDFLSSAELYDRATNTFTPTGSSNNAESGSGTAIVLWTGKLLVAGGGTNQAELYDPEMPGTSETWVAAGNLPAARTSHQETLLDDGRVLMTGGLPDSTGTSTPLKSAVLYDYFTGDFTAAGDMTIERQQHRDVLLYTGKVLVTGGRPLASSNVLKSAELYDPVTNTFTATGNMVANRRLHRATALRNGKVLITGGLGNSGVFLSTAELYNPATGTFTQTTSGMATGRRSHQATLLYTGKVLVAGGFMSSTAVTATAELYDPATNTFTATGSMITARTSPTLTHLPNGKVLVQGGSDATGTPIQSVEIYDPATGTFTVASAAPVARDGNRVTRLDNGMPISVGGQTTATSSSVVNTADLYNHITGTFSATGSLITGRQDFSLTSLPNGRILVAGGIDAAGTALTSAELYTPLIGDLVETTITSGPAELTNSTSATFSFTADPAGGSFTCSLDGSAFDACTSPKDYSSLANGSHNFQVHATDALGNTDPTPANYNWTVDTTPPDTNIITHPATLTNGTSATFEFTATEAATFECDLDGGGFSACTSPKSFSGLADGAHTFQVRATDGAGNTDATPANFTWTVDTTPPDTIVDNGPASPTELTSADFVFHSTEAGSGFQCQLDGGGFSACTSPKNYAALSLGAHSFDVKATDPAGNTDGSAASFSWTVVDLTPPNTIIDTSPASSTILTSAGFSFHSTESGSSFQCQLDSGGFSGCTSPQNYVGLAVGAHSFEVKATDASGNTDPTPANFNWSITAAPDTIINSGPTASSGGVTNSTAAIFSFSSTDPAATFACSLDGGVFAACTSPKNYTKLKVRAHSFKVQATAGGLTDPTAASFDWTIDNRSPNTAITSGPSVLTNNPVATLAFTSTEAGSSFQCSLDGSAFVSCPSPFVSSPLADGKHAFQVRAVDAAGNVDKSAAKAKAWTVDTTRPITTITGKPTDPTTSSKVAFKFTSEKKSTFQCSLDGGAFTSCKSGQKYSGLAKGSHSFQVKATDAAGNVELTPVSYSWTQN